MGLDRRGVLKFIAGAGAGVMVTPIPWKLIDDVSIWSQNWSWIPSNIKGGNAYVPMVSKLCPSAGAMKLRLVDGRPVRVVSNPDHPLGGGITALMAAEAELLYSPARLKRPLKRNSDGAFATITWEEAEKLLAANLKAAGKDLACVCGDDNGSTGEVLSAFLAGRGSKDFFYMPSEAQAAAKALDLMGISANVQIGYRLEDSDFILAIGANALESWGTVVRNRHIFAKTHPHGEDSSMTFAYAGPVQNNSAAVAKPWLPIKPGTELAFALGLANILISKGKTVNAPDFAAFKDLAAQYPPEKTAAATGLPAKALQTLADSLLKAQKPLVLAGSEFSQGGGAAPVMAGLALNTLLGATGPDGALALLKLADPVLTGATSRKDAYKRDFAAYLGSKASPKAMIVYEANPVYGLPDPEAIKKHLAVVPFKVAFSTFLDETAELCDLILPLPMGLERLDDVETPYGSGTALYAVNPAAVKPLVDAKPGPDLFFALAKTLGLNLGAASYEEVLKAKAKALGADYAKLLKGEAAVLEGRENAAGATRADLLAKVLERKVPAGALAVAPVFKLNLGTAKTGIPPFNTKTLRANELGGRQMYVMLNAATAGKLGLAEGSAASLSVPGTKTGLTALVHVYEGITPDTVGIYLGFGHTALDEFSRNKGANVMQLLTASPEPDTGLMVWNLAGVNAAKA